MCGFAGFYNLQRRNFSVDQKLLDRMQQSIAHRGPDAVGYWSSEERGLGLTSRRLSIIDLTEAGNQPMYSQRHNVVACYNGEIYNHQELRKELEARGFVYNSTSDTETIINAYKAWGIEGINRFEGMFAIALFDLEKNVLYLVRDRMGVKPIYFSLLGGVLSFASEIKALQHLPWIDRKINNRAWYHYLTFMVPPAPLTIFEGIYKLPAGFYAEVDRFKRVSFKEWYSPLPALDKYVQKECAGEEFCIKRITELLLDSTQKRMVADVPVGAYLSGGLDSSLNVALMSRFHKNIETFTIAFADDAGTNELSWARKVAQQFKTHHHELVISEKEAFDFYEKMVMQLDEPLADCVCIPFYYVSQLAREHGMKVVQVGEGADELFFGYPTYVRHAQMFKSLWQPSRLLMPKFVRAGVAYAARPFMHAQPLRQEFVANWAQGRHSFWGGAIAFGEEQKRFIRDWFVKRPLDDDYVISQVYPGMSQELDSYSIIDYHIQKLLNVAPHADIGQVMLYVELKQRLPELLLMRADKMAMAASIEAREPYLDHKLVEFMFNVPVHLKYKGGQTKYLLKKVAEQFLPSEIIYRPKVGFAAPTFHWFAHGSYFPSYFEKLATEFMHFPISKGAQDLWSVDVSKNKNERHRAVQNWVLQQLWAFTRGQ